MPVQTSYPGVYVQNVPSGVRTITGVSTSVAAFVGKAKRGPINRAVPIFSFSDFERLFGGLSSNSEMSYGVRQFFLNGGTQAIIVRLAKDPVAAFQELENDPSQNDQEEVFKVLQIEALDAGEAGNNIEIRIDYKTSNPDSTFNLTVLYSSSENPSDNQSEVFENLSMNREHPRYVEQQVNEFSNLVRATSIVPQETLNDLAPGTSKSGELSDVGSLLDANHNALRISINGLEPIDVLIAEGLVNAAADALVELCRQLEEKVKQHPLAQLYKAMEDFSCTADGNCIKMTSGGGGENSRVAVIGGVAKDASRRLKLGIGNGGQEKDSVSAIRPKEAPDRGTLISGELVVADIALDEEHHKFKISIDGGRPVQVELPIANLADGAKLDNLIQDYVRAKRPSAANFGNFTCTFDDNNRLILSSGSRGTGSSILISSADNEDIAGELKLLSGIDGAEYQEAYNLMLEGGSEQDFSEEEAYPVYIGSPEDKEGIFALEDVDIFNILCLPGIRESGILMEAEAYCRRRRAFFIIDPPRNERSPAQVSDFVRGTALPKSDHVGFYYPSIEIPDPLRRGQLRTTAPSGTLAGLFARTDANRGVWKAPAGTEAVMVGVRKLSYSLTDSENGILNPIGINCLRVFPASGVVSWGARTLVDPTSEWRYIPVRRTALFIEESLYRGLQWVVFEPNDEPLWGQIRLNVGAFMHNLFRQGAFQGVTKQEAYFVKCDKETTTQNDINQGRVNILVGFAPLKPAEFVIVQLQQMAGQIQT